MNLRLWGIIVNYYYRLSSISDLQTFIILQNFNCNIP